MRQAGTKKFEWDKGNIDKSYEKHGTTPNQTEEVFLDNDLVIIPDITHSIDENRLIAIGLSGDKKMLFIVFTMRKKNIRIISAQRANAKERKLYEKKKV